LLAVLNPLSVFLAVEEEVVLSNFNLESSYGLGSTKSTQLGLRSPKNAEEDP